MKTILLLALCFNASMLAAQLSIAPETAANSSYHTTHTHSANETCTHPTVSNYASNRLNFIENKKQWHANIEYLCELGGLDHVYLEKDAFTYVFHDKGKTDELHDIMRMGEEEKKRHMIPGHAYQVKFLNALPSEMKGADQRAAFNNYLLGNVEENWASDVPVFQKISYSNIYDGIELLTYSQEGNLKYDFIVAPNANADVIQLEYIGMDKVFLEDEDLVVQTSVRQIKELKPYAYQIIKGEKIEVPCNYLLNENILSFEFPDGYDTDNALIIDPTVVGATLSGTTNNENFGHSATFDNVGNIYTAGISFGAGYPTTMGAFQNNFAGGNTDIAVSKYNTDGTDLLYATYIGGSSLEYPHSTIVDFNGQLCVYGISFSTNYPVTTNAFQSQNGGGNDIVVTKLNSTGTALIGSTYIGGSATDGRNTSGLNANYGDDYRGEIVLDPQGNIFIASCSSSNNFPVSDNAFQQTKGNSSTNDQDGVLIKFSADLSTLYWATYLGSSRSDICFGLRVDDFGDVYTTGYAGNSDFPMVNTGLQSTWPGGQENAYVVKISRDGSSMLNGTFWGTNGDEHGYFIDIDEDDQIHIYGTTTGEMTVTPDTYFRDLGSNQFITAFSNDLTELVYSTVIGTGGSFNDFVPVAFMVDKCNAIYFSGYYASNSLPLTSDAVFTGANSFYLGVLEPEAKGLSFGTYYGRADHVDGGTSRFDKAGIVYQAVCSCTSGGTVMNTTAGAWSENQSTHCDVGVFKIDFEISTVTASAQVLPATSGCAPFDAEFAYTGQDAETIFWDFGNGSTSTDFNPSQTFTEAGSYTIMQIVQAGNTCNVADTFFLEMEIFDGSSSLTNTTFCQGQDDLILDASAVNASYAWQDGSTAAVYQVTDAGIYWVEVSIPGCSRIDSFIVESTSTIDVDLGADISLCDIPNFTFDATDPSAVSYLWQDGSTDPTLTVTATGEYSVLVSDVFGCEISDTVAIQIGQTPVVDLGPDINLCVGETVDLDASSPDASYSWQDGSTDAVFTVTESGQYSVVVNNHGCESIAGLTVNYFTNPGVEFEPVDVECPGDTNGSISATFAAGSNDLDFVWETGATLPDLYDLAPGVYTVTITNEWDCVLESAVTVGTPLPIVHELGFQDVICFGDENGLIQIQGVSGGTEPYQFAINDEPFSPINTFSNLSGGFYTLTIQDAHGCLAMDSLNIYEPPAPVVVDAGPDHVIDYGDDAWIRALATGTINQSIEWTPPDSLSCIDCLEPIANPIQNTEYIITLRDTISGCLHQDTMMIRIEKPRDIYIPNVFSPNGDGNNDNFLIHGGRSVQRINTLKIFDRWGEVIWAGENLPPSNEAFGWDGTFQGKLMNPAVFVFLAEVTFIDGEVRSYQGDFTLIR